MRQPAFSIGLKGVLPSDVEKVEALIFSTLEQLARDGIDPDTIAASLNTIEFALRERNTGRFPRGLSLMFDGLNEWLYDFDPIAALAFAGPLEQTKRALKENPRLFPTSLHRFFTQHTSNNCHAASFCNRESGSRGS